MTDQNNYPQNNGSVPGKGAAIGSLVLGIVGVVLAILFGVFGGVIGIILGIIGIVLASNAKRAGFVGGMRTGGFVLSIISIVLGVIMVILVVAAGAALLSLA